MKKLISYFLNQEKNLKNNNDEIINNKKIELYEIIDKYKKEYTLDIPFSNCLNLKNNYLNILDIGCYGESIPEQFASQKNINFYGVDIDEKNISYLKNKYCNNANYFFYSNEVVAPKNLDLFHKIYKYHFKNKFKIVPFENPLHNKYSKIGPSINQTTQKTNSNSSKPVKLTIDEIVLENDIRDINFLKIDIDSNDTDVLYGSENLLNNDNLFGVKIEVNFTNPYSSKNIYEPILYLTDHNFVLHKIITNSYVSDRIPEKFFYNFSGQNLNGTDFYGDLIFFKTLDDDFITTLDKKKLLNFCRILEIHNLNGMAAEILLKSKKKFSSEEIKNYLNKLCEKSSFEIFGKILDYETFKDRVDNNPQILLNSQFE